MEGKKTTFSPLLCGATLNGAGWIHECVARRLWVVEIFRLWNEMKYTCVCICLLKYLPTDLPTYSSVTLWCYFVERAKHNYCQHSFVLEIAFEWILLIFPPPFLLCGVVLCGVSLDAAFCHCRRLLVALLTVPGYRIVPFPFEEFSSSIVCFWFRVGMSSRQTFSYFLPVFPSFGPLSSTHNLVYFSIWVWFESRCCTIEVPTPFVNLNECWRRWCVLKWSVGNKYTAQIRITSH